MRNRALVQIEDNEGNFSPVLYLWNAKNIENIIEKIESQIKRNKKVNYVFGILIQNVCKFGDCLNMEIKNKTKRLEEKDSFGDEGCIIINCETWDIEKLGQWL